MEKIFIDGLRLSKPSPKAPEWIKAKVSFKVDELIEFLKKHDKNGWVNADLKESKSGNFYMELDTFKPNNGSSEDVPF